jgi:hypothetical protein
MTEKEDNLQLELFTQSKDTSDSRSRTFSKSFLAYIWNYEKTILIIIAVVITGIVSFSLGVEKGKRLAMLENSPAGFVEQREEVIKQPVPIEKENYVIQLASYKIKTHAQKEVELLKKRGLSPLVLSKGSYIVLCVGNISNKETARSLLSELKKRYRDCYITRL